MQNKKGRAEEKGEKVHFFLVQFSNLICLRAATMYVQIGFVIFQFFAAAATELFADFLAQFGTECK